MNMRMQRPNIYLTRLPASSLSFIRLRDAHAALLFMPYQDLPFVHCRGLHLKKKKKHSRTILSRKADSTSLIDRTNREGTVLMKVGVRGPEHSRSASLCPTALIPLSLRGSRQHSWKTIGLSTMLNPCFLHSSPPLAPKYAEQTRSHAELPMVSPTCTLLILSPLWRVLFPILLLAKNQFLTEMPALLLWSVLEGYTLSLLFLCFPWCLVCASLSCHCALL